MRAIPGRPAHTDRLPLHGRFPNGPKPKPNHGKYSQNRDQKPKDAPFLHAVISNPWTMPESFCYASQTTNSLLSVQRPVSASRHRQGNRDDRPLTGLGLDLHLAAMGFHHAAHNGQAESGAFALGGAEKRGEGALAMFLGHALAAVAELDGNMGCRLVRSRNFQRP